MLRFLTATSAQGDPRDSLWVQGRITSADSIHATLDWRLNTARRFPAMDTLWSRLPRNRRPRRVGEDDGTQAQLEQAWPRWTDSVVFSLFLDSAGLGLQLATDTLMASWAPRQSGCFPASSPGT